MGTKHKALLINKDKINHFHTYHNDETSNAKRVYNKFMTDETELWKNNTLTAIKNKETVKNFDISCDDFFDDAEYLFMYIIDNIDNKKLKETVKKKLPILKELKKEFNRKKMKNIEAKKIFEKENKDLKLEFQQDNPDTAMENSIQDIVSNVLTTELNKKNNDKENNNNDLIEKIKKHFKEDNNFNKQLPENKKEKLNKLGYIHGIKTESIDKIKTEINNLIEKIEEKEKAPEDKNVEEEKAKKKAKEKADEEKAKDDGDEELKKYYTDLVELCKKLHYTKFIKSDTDKDLSKGIEKYNDNLTNICNGVDVVDDSNATKLDDIKEYTYIPDANNFSINILEI